MNLLPGWPPFTEPWDIDPLREPPEHRACRERTPEEHLRLERRPLVMCQRPDFVWIGGWWSPCTACGRLAWDHEQADPLADVHNHIEAARTGRGPQTCPPVMRSTPWPT